MWNFIKKYYPVIEPVHNESARTQWLENVLASIPNGERLLDAGAGQLAMKPYCAHLEYVAQDFAQYDGKGDGAGLHPGEWDQSHLDIVSDICSIPEPDASFGAILCVEVFEHLPNPIAALKEFSRLLKHGGELILTAPFCACTHFSPYFFNTGFSRYWYEKHLTDAGFTIVELTPNGNFHSYILQELHRAPEMAMKYASVKPNRIEQIALHITKSFFSRILTIDLRSHEFLCFGYHVRAIK
jgi:SAM-dependent methyltransferase